MNFFFVNQEYFNQKSMTNILSYQNLFKELKIKLTTTCLRNKIIYQLLT